MILQRGVMHQNRAIEELEAPSWLAIDRVAQRDAALFGELVWEAEPGGRPAATGTPGPSARGVSAQV